MSKFKYLKTFENMDWDNPEFLKEAKLNTSKYSDVITFLLIRYYSERFPKEIKTFTIINGINFGYIRNIIEKEEKLKEIFGINYNLWTPNTNRVLNKLKSNLELFNNNPIKESKDVAKDLIDEKLCRDLIEAGKTFFNEKLYKDIIDIISVNSSKGKRLEDVAKDAMPHFTDVSKYENRIGSDLINKYGEKMQVKAFNYIKAIEENNGYFILLKKSENLDLSKFTDKKHLKDIKYLTLARIVENRKTLFVIDTSNIVEVLHLVPPKEYDDDKYDWSIELNDNVVDYYRQSEGRWNRFLYYRNLFKKI